MRLLLGLVLVAACGGGRPATTGTAPAAKESPELTARLAALDEALRERPDDQVLLLLRGAFAAEAGRAVEALQFVEKLDATGWDVPFTSADFKPIANDARFQAAAARIAARAALVKRSEVAFTIAGEPDFIPEGIAVDSASGTFYVGSIRKRKIVAIDRSGRARTFATDGLSGVLGLKVDAQRGVLWATSWASEGMEGFTPADKGRSEVTAFGLADGSVRRRAVLPAGASPHLLNDIAIADDGTLFVTDSEAGAVWRVPPGRDVLEPLVPAGSFAYPNGIVLANSTQVYVAHGTGIAIVDVATGAMTRMEPGRNVPLAGIDGMVLDGSVLVAVQNGLGAPRIVAITIEGTRATGLRVLENDPGVLELPTTTTLHDGALYTIANAQLDALGPEGLRRDKQLHDPRIVRTPR